MMFCNQSEMFNQKSDLILTRNVIIELVHFGGAPRLSGIPGLGAGCVGHSIENERELAAFTY